MNKTIWEKSLGQSNYQDIVGGKTVTKTTFTRRVELNTDPLKSRNSAFGNGMKKRFIKASLGNHKQPFFKA